MGDGGELVGMVGWRSCLDFCDDKSIDNKAWLEFCWKGESLEINQGINFRVSSYVSEERKEENKWAGRREERCVVIGWSFGEIVWGICLQIGCGMGVWMWMWAKGLMGEVTWMEHGYCHSRRKKNKSCETGDDDDIGWKISDGMLFSGLRDEGIDKFLRRLCAIGRIQMKGNTTFCERGDEFEFGYSAIGCECTFEKLIYSSQWICLLRIVRIVEKSTWRRLVGECDLRMMIECDEILTFVVWGMLHCGNVFLSALRILVTVLVFGIVWKNETKIFGRWRCLCYCGSWRSDEYGCLGGCRCVG